MDKEAGLVGVLVSLVLALILFGGVYWYLHSSNTASYSNTPADTNPSNTEARVKDYLNANLGTLSSEPEVLGGKFFVTDLSLDGGGKGVVTYEDGHNQYTADFTYTENSNGDIAVEKFEVR